VQTLSRTEEVHENMRQLFALAVVTVALTVTAAAPGVIGGDHDNGAHPSTGALVVPTSLGYGYSRRAGKRQFVYDGYRHQAAIPPAGQTAAMLKLKDPGDASVCFGDSGGPQYLPGSTMIVSVTSGGNAQCKKGEATRLDTDSVRSFLSAYVKLP
jgi:hypothetical protein